MIKGDGTAASKQKNFYDKYIRTSLKRTAYNIERSRNRKSMDFEIIYPECALSLTAYVILGEYFTSLSLNSIMR